MSNVVLTPYFRASYLNIFKPRKNDMSGKDEFSVVALFPKGADLADLKQLAAKTAEEKWPKGLPGNLKLPFRDQGERSKLIDGKSVLPDGYEEGAVFINLKSLKAPGIIDATAKRIITDETEIYSGCWLRAAVSCYAYDQKGNRGVAFGLLHIQKVKDDAPLSRSTPQAEFAPIPGAKADSSQPVDAMSLFS